MSTRPEPVAMNAVDVEVVHSGGGRHGEIVPWLRLAAADHCRHMIRLDAVLSWSTTRVPGLRITTIAGTVELTGDACGEVDRLLYQWLVTGPPGVDLGAPALERFLPEEAKRRRRAGMTPSEVAEEIGREAAAEALAAFFPAGSAPTAEEAQ